MHGEEAGRIFAVALGSPPTGACPPGVALGPWGGWLPHLDAHHGQRQTGDSIITFLRTHVPMVFHRDHTIFHFFSSLTFHVPTGPQVSLKSSSQ